MLNDYHVHTAFSDDSDYALEDVVKDAIRKNIEEVCFTDHVDYGVKPDWGQPYTRFWHDKPVLNVNYPEFEKEYLRVKSLYNDQITLKMGFEFGVQMHTIDAFNALFKRYPLDFVILSIHQVEDQEFWTQDFQKNRTQKEYNERYYEELYNVVCAFKNYSVVGHLDLIRRYDEAGVYPFEKLKPIIQKILTQVIQDGKGIEVNTSSFRYGLDDLMPSTAILELYRDCGGTLLTLGSDSHKEEHLGAYITLVKKKLKALGFKQYCTFDQMKPIYHDL